MRLQFCTWPQVEAHLNTSRGIIIPIGSTEQHGPTGLLGTDALCAEAVAVAAGERLDVMVAPCINVGMAVHHMAFPGSMTLRPSTLIAVIRDTVVGLASHGYRRFLFVNGHGGNIATLQSAWYEVHCAMREMRDGGGSPTPLRFSVQNWWAGTQVKRYCDEVFGPADGSHATCGELSLMHFLYPDRAPETAPLEPRVAGRHAFHDADHFRAVHPDGRMGSDPSLASAEHGGRLFDIAVSEAVEAYKTLMAE